MMMLALFHAVPLTISLIWSVVAKYVRTALENYRYRRSIRTLQDEADIVLGVESAMPHISNENTPTPSGKSSTTTDQRSGGQR